MNCIVTVVQSSEVLLLSILLGGGATASDMCHIFSKFVDFRWVAFLALLVCQWVTFSAVWVTSFLCSQESLVLGIGMNSKTGYKWSSRGSDFRNPSSTPTQFQGDYLTSMVLTVPLPPKNDKQTKIKGRI